MKTTDVIVLGVGAMGSATCYQLAKRGIDVIGLEQFEVGHDRGSSHGETRMIRKAYFEHPAYVPLLNRAYELWDELCLESKASLLHRVGLILYGKEGQSAVLKGVLESASRYQLEVVQFDRKEALKKYPGYVLPEGYVGILEPEAGDLEVENCVIQYSRLAKKHGAKIHEKQIVINWSVKGNNVEVKTDKDTFQASKLVLTAGAWTTQLLHQLKIPISVHRNFLFWFPADKNLYAPKHTPCFGIELGNRFFYGFPVLDKFGLKIADHTPGEKLTDPSNLKKDPSKNDIEPILNCLRTFLPGIQTTPSKSAPCLYSMTPDEHFVIDFHPEHSNVLFAGGFSGHGFKFSSVVGEVLADLATTGKTTLPIDFLKLRWS